MGIKQELLVLDGLLFLIFSGNFGFRLSALLALQKKRDNPSDLGFPGKAGEQRAPKSSGTGIFLGEGNYRKRRDENGNEQ